MEDADGYCAALPWYWASSTPRPFFLPSQLALAVGWDPSQVNLTTLLISSTIGTPPSPAQTALLYSQLPPDSLRHFALCAPGWWPARPAVAASPPSLPSPSLRTLKNLPCRHSKVPLFGEVIKSSTKSMVCTHPKVPLFVETPSPVRFSRSPT